MTIHDFNSERIAEQMTLLDLDLFQKIEVIWTNILFCRLFVKCKQFDKRSQVVCQFCIVGPIISPIGMCLLWKQVMYSLLVFANALLGNLKLS